MVAHEDPQLPAHTFADVSSGVVSSGRAAATDAAAGCGGCAALSEALLEAEFLRELSTAQLGVVLEEMDLLAAQHESLVQLLAQSNMEECHLHLGDPG
jgi:NAD(P)H-nitrite reductase large subunit